MFKKWVDFLYLISITLIQNTGVGINASIIQLF